jgi:hypothetical protein
LRSKIYFDDYMIFLKDMICFNWAKLWAIFDCTDVLLILNSELVENIIFLGGPLMGFFHLFRCTKVIVLWVIREETWLWYDINYSTWAARHKAPPALLGCGKARMFIKTVLATATPLWCYRTHLHAWWQHYNIRALAGLYYIDCA